MFQKNGVETFKTHILCSTIFSPQNLAFMR